jgi:hypothetical protein
MEELISEIGYPSTDRNDVRNKDDQKDTINVNTNHILQTIVLIN